MLFSDQGSEQRKEDVGGAADVRPCCKSLCEFEAAHMNPRNWQRVKQIFHSAVDLPTGERAKFIARACQGDKDLQEEIQRLLTADECAGSFLENPNLTDHSASTQSQLMHFLSPGNVVAGRFEIVSFLGQGGMGEVYKVRDLELGDQLALKTIRPEIACDTNIIARFKREIQLARRVTHPNVCRIFDLGHHAPTANVSSEPKSRITFLTMELLDGENLAERLRRQGAIRTIDALPLVQDMVGALAAAHDVGIVHRDFKPSNVMLVPTPLRPVRAVVTDFGLARSISVDFKASAAPDSVTGTGHLVGTFAYMAPEQLEGGEISTATDIYAMGLVIYELVTNKRAFSETSSLRGVFARLQDPPHLARAVVPELDPRWDLAISKCLQLDPAARFRNVRDILTSLTSTSDIPNIEQPKPSIRRLSSNVRDRVFNTRGLQPASRKVFGAIVFILALLLVSFALFRLLWHDKSVPFAERDWILVADFKNQTGEEMFDRVVSDLVGQALSQSSFINVVPRFTAIEAAKRTGLAEVKEIDAGLGRQVCLRENYRALLTGAISKSAGMYHIEVAVTDPRSGSAVVTDSESMHSSADLYAAVDRLTLRIRRHLGESLSKLERTKPLAQVTTPSLEALQRYSLAVDLYGAREFARSVALAKDAVDRDPNFSMAHLLLARAYDQLGDGTDARLEFHAASTGLEHVSERERHLILAMDYSAQGLDDKAAEEFQHLLDIYPDDVDSLRGLAESLFWIGRTTEAVNAQRKALQLNPNSVIDYDHMLTLLIRNSEFGQALAVYNQALAHKIDSPSLRFGAALAAWGQGDLQATQKTFDLLKDENSDYWKVVAQLYSGRLLAYEGKMLEADEALRRGLSLVQRPGWENWIPVYQYLLTRTEVMRGRMKQARFESERFDAAARLVSTPENLQRAGRLAIEVGDFESAKRFDELMKRKYANQKDAFTQMHLYNLSGDVNLAYQRTEAAIQNQEQALTFHKGFEAYLSLGQACEKAMKWKCAADAYTSYLQFKGEIIRDDFAADWVSTHYSLARVYLRAGDSTAALKCFDQFLQLFAVADKDLPNIREAQYNVRGLRMHN